MKKIAIVAYETEPAVCSSMMMHVNMMSEAGYDIVMLVLYDIDHSLFKNVRYPIEFYKHYQELTDLLKKYKVDKIWCTNPMYVLKLVRITKLPIYLWKQGDTAAESFMAHHSYLRKWLLQMIDAYTLRKVTGVIYVSNSMKEYYETKYKVRTKSVVVPCLSEFAQDDFKVERIPNSYVYIGGLSIWQCFEETLKIYSKIRTPESIFHIITLNTELAYKKVIEIIGDDTGIKIYGIKDRAQIPSTLGQFQYGFLIRKKDTVNQVAAPIKFLEYLSCGVNVIMTNAVPSYAEIVEKERVGTVLNIDEDNININTFNPKAKDIYRQLFNHDKYVAAYKRLLHE